MQPRNLLFGKNGHIARARQRRKVTVETALQPHQEDMFWICEQLRARHEPPRFVSVTNPQSGKSWMRDSFMEHRQFFREEICRVFDVPYWMLFGTTPRQWGNPERFSDGNV